jgi:16S rRNA (guanine(966)-N(2))-methyltransferase RsmD
VTRIVAGTRGGRRLATPPGRGTRPTADRVREALFSSLDALLDIDGCAFVDLYAGSGAVGLEAASRGAARVLLVESDLTAARAARDNVSTLGLGGVCQVAVSKVAAVLVGGPGRGGGYDVVFADPPYDVGDDELEGMLALLVEHGWLAGGAVVVIERSTRSPEPPWVPPVTALRRRKYGETTLWYGRRAAPEPGAGPG